MAGIPRPIAFFFKGYLQLNANKDLEFRSRAHQAVLILNFKEAIKVVAKLSLFTKAVKFVERNWDFFTKGIVSTPFKFQIAKTSGWSLCANVVVENDKVFLVLFRKLLNSVERVHFDSSEITVLERFIIRNVLPPFEFLAKCLKEERTAMSP